MTDFTKPDGYSSWNTIYPVYINSKRTRNEGRRIPVDLCCEDPTINELESVTGYKTNFGIFKVRCVFAMVVISMLPAPMTAGKTHPTLHHKNGLLDSS